MASFELKILTEDPAELKGLVDKLCSVRVEVRNEIRGTEAHVAVEERVLVPGEKLEPVSLEDIDQETTTTPVAQPAPDPTLPVTDRDAEGLKRDARIHSDAAEPFKADGTWKRKRNTPDDLYDSAYEELAREAHAGGLYKGPLLGQFELEARVVDTEQAPAAETVAPAPAPVVEQVAPAPVAPAPAPVAPAPAGLSAQVSSSEERCKSLLTGMVKKVGPAVAVAALRMYGATAVTMLTPEQRESFCDVSEAMMADPEATSDNGSDKLAAIAAALGVAV